MLPEIKAVVDADGDVTVEVSDWVVVKPDAGLVECDMVVVPGDVLEEA